MIKSQTDIRYFNREKGKRINLKDCTIESNFLFSKMDFYTVSKSGVFFICIAVDGILTSLWHYKAPNATAGEAMSEFRKKFLANGITKDKIDEFINDPIKYEKERKKKVSK